MAMSDDSMVLSDDVDFEQNRHAAAAHNNSLQQASTLRSIATYWSSADWAIRSTKITAAASPFDTTSDPFVPPNRRRITAIVGATTVILDAYAVHSNHGHHSADDITSAASAAVRRAAAAATDTNQTVSAGDSADDTTADDIIFVGGSVTAVKWCPTHDSRTQFIAVAHSADPDATFVRVGRTAARDELITIWNAGILHKTSESSPPMPTAPPQLALAIRHNHGPVTAMEWAPIITQQNVTADATEIGRIGILCATCTDGSVLVVAIPDPLHISIAPNVIPLSALPHVTLMIPPMFRSVESDTFGVSMSISSSPTAPPRMAVGTTDGALVVWDLSVVRPNGAAVLPTHHIQCRSHSPIVRSVCWNPSNAHQIVIGASDGVVIAYDLRWPASPILTVTNDADPVTAIVWPLHKSDRIIAASGNQMRVYFAGDNDPAASRTSVSYHPHNNIPIAHSTAVNAVTIHDDAAIGMTTIFSALSDGSINAYSQRSMEIGSEKIYCRSKQVSLLRLSQYTEDDAGHGQAAVNIAGPFYSVESASRTTSTSIKEHRLGLVKSPTEFESALDDYSCQLSVDVNKAYQHPKWVASGGASGVVRLQIVTDI